MCLTAYPRSNEERLPLRRGSGGSWNGNRKRNAAAGIAAITNSVYTLELYASYFYRTLYDLLKSRVAVGSPSSQAAARRALDPIPVFRFDYKNYLLGKPK